jgi:hypothetical protein
MCAALRTRPASELLALVTGADADGGALQAAQAEDAALARALPRWRERLSEIPSPGRLAAWQDGGMRLIMPGDAEWPTQLDDLGDARPLLLWARGAADLRLTCVNSVSIVGTRAAATGYGNHVALEMAATLAEHDVSVVSGGAYGIDACVRRYRRAGGGCAPLTRLGQCRCVLASSRLLQGPGPAPWHCWSPAPPSDWDRAASGWIRSSCRNQSSEPRGVLIRTSATQLCH